MCVPRVATWLGRSVRLLDWCGAGGAESTGISRVASEREAAAALVSVVRTGQLSRKAANKVGGWEASSQEG